MKNKIILIFTIILISIFLISCLDFEKDLIQSAHFRMENYTPFGGEFLAWNCEGLVGTWTLRMWQEVPYSTGGVLTGEGNFQMPPKPSTGYWDSNPFNYTIDGTYFEEEFRIDIEVQYINVIFTIIEMEDAPTLMDGKGSLIITVTVTHDEGSHTVVDTADWILEVPAIINFGDFEECR